MPDLASCGCLLLAVCDPICNLQTKREAYQLNRLSDSQVGRRLSLYAVGQNFRPLGNNDLWILQVFNKNSSFTGILTFTRSHVKSLTAVVFDGSLQRVQRLPKCWIFAGNAFTTFSRQADGTGFAERIIKGVRRNPSVERYQPARLT